MDAVCPVEVTTSLPADAFPSTRTTPACPSLHRAFYDNPQTLHSMFGRSRRMLIRPKAAIEGRPTALAGPLGLVFVLGVVAVGGTLVPALGILDTQMPSILPDSPAVSLATGSDAVAIPSVVLEIMVLSLVVPFVLWVLTALLVHVLTWFVALAGAIRGGRPAVSTGYPTRSSLATRFDGFRRTLVAVGWGYAPQILASLVTAGVLVSFSLAGPDVLPKAMLLTPAGHTVVKIPKMPAFTLLTHSVGAVSVVWTGYVWVGGLQATRGVSRRTAVAVVVPVSLFLLFVSDLIGNLGLIG